MWSNKSTENLKDNIFEVGLLNNKSEKQQMYKTTKVWCDVKQQTRAWRHWSRACAGLQGHCFNRPVSRNFWRGSNFRLLGYFRNKLIGPPVKKTVWIYIWRWTNNKRRLRGSGGMPPGIFVRFLTTNWCSLVDSGGCRWGKFSALWSRGGGGRGRATLSNPLSPPNGPGFKES